MFRFPSNRIRDVSLTSSLTATGVQISETESRHRRLPDLKTRKGSRLFRLKVARSAAEVEELKSAWDLLPSHTMFQGYSWNRLAAEVFSSREEPYFIFAENDSGAAILPAVVDTKSKCISLAGERLFDYRDYLVVGDHRPLEAAWEHVAELNLPLSITAIRQPDKFAWDRLPKGHFCRAPWLDKSRTSAEDYVETHTRAFERFRRLERMGVEIRQYGGTSPIVREIYELRRKQAEPGELFTDTTRIEFMVAMCREAGRRCEVFALEQGSTLVAVIITFLDRDFRRFYTTYYDREWASYSPGVSLLFEVARRSLEQGLNVDLMTGELPFKVRIAPNAQDLFCVNASARQLQEAFLDSTQEIAA